MNVQTPRLVWAMALTALTTTLLMGCSKAPDTAPATPSSPGTVGMQVDDTVITTSVKTALLADPDIKSLDISVQTVKGEVQLSGVVNNQSQIDQASQIARNTRGASSVKNELRIKQ